MKTRLYYLEGWDEEGGWPTRESLESYDLAEYADALEEAGVIKGE